MKIFRSTSVLAILLLFLNLGCSEEDPEPAPALEIEVVKLNNGNTTRVVGAVIKLYASIEDFSRMQNPVGEMKTDEYGKAIFRNLKQIDYYWSVYSGCLTNYYDRFSTRVPLKSNTQPNYTSLVAETAYVSIVNKTSNKYDVNVGATYTSLGTTSYIAEPNSSRNYIFPSTQVHVSYTPHGLNGKNGLSFKSLACGEHWIVEINN